MNNSFNTLFRLTYFIILIVIISSETIAKENKLFWDGRDWNRVLASVGYNKEACFRVKTAYLHGALDGRLYAYLKVWKKDQGLADDVFSETVDYLSNRELIKNIDYFYQEPLNNYVPVPSAILIANMYAERIAIDRIESYIESTRNWINNLVLDLDTLNYSRLLEDKWIKHHEKQLNQYE